MRYMWRRTYNNRVSVCRVAARHRDALREYRPAGRSTRAARRWWHNEMCACFWLRVPSSVVLLRRNGFVLILRVLGLFVLVTERNRARLVVSEAVLHVHVTTVHVDELPAGGVTFEERIGLLHSQCDTLRCRLGRGSPYHYSRPTGHRSLDNRICWLMLNVRQKNHRIHESYQQISSEILISLQKY